MKNFRTLDLAKEFYKKAQRVQLKGALKNQYERAILSIPLNLAEGTVKPSPKERQRFYYTALGSLREVQMILELTGNSLLLKESDDLARHLYLLCKRTRYPTKHSTVTVHENGGQHTQHRSASKKVT